jgi:Holliday junction DNA helicase RuvA
MIGYLKGHIAHKTPTFIFLDVQGIGYHINISLHTFGKLEGLQEALIFTHMHVREDEISLYGFFEEEEKQLFVQLISVSGIGCNTARVILSYMNTDELKRAIINEDEFSISKVKGIGPKTAKRIILDLKDKIIKSSGIEPNTIGKSSNVGIVVSSIREEAMAALIALGFPKVGLDKQINAAFTKNPDIKNVEDLIKNVLKAMS